MLLIIRITSIIVMIGIIIFINIMITIVLTYLLLLFSWRIWLFHFSSNFNIEWGYFQLLYVYYNVLCIVRTVYSPHRYLITRTNEKRKRYFSKCTLKIEIHLGTLNFMLNTSDESVFWEGNRWVCSSAYYRWDQCTRKS